MTAVCLLIHSINSLLSAGYTAAKQNRLKICSAPAKKAIKLNEEAWKTWKSIGLQAPGSESQFHAYHLLDKQFGICQLSLNSVTWNSMYCLSCIPHRLITYKEKSI